MGVRRVAIGENTLAGWYMCDIGNCSRWIDEIKEGTLGFVNRPREEPFVSDSVCVN